jgi:2EXR family
MYFPKLPTELRWKILEHALPIGTKGRRFIQVKARISAPSRFQKPAWFVLEENAYSSDVKDVGLLSANKESRNIYLRYFGKSLRAKGDGLIRYRDDDTIYICK